jgi:hypothetical protein
LPYELVTGRSVSGLAGADGSFGAAARASDAGLADADFAAALSSAMGRSSWRRPHAWSFESISTEPLPLHNPQYRGTHGLDDAEASARADLTPWDPTSLDAEDAEGDELVQGLVGLSADPAATASGVLLRRFWSRLREAVSQNDRDLAEAIDETVAETSRLFGDSAATETVFRVADGDGRDVRTPDPSVPADVPAQAEDDEPSPQEPAPAATPSDQVPSRL